MTSVINTTPGNKYYRFTNADGKMWIMPAKNMQVAMNLYQPSGIKGKLLKYLFPYIHRIAFVRKAIKTETLDCELETHLQSLLCRIFATKDFEFAIFGGTPCVHQKITIQVFKKKHILGYCKIANSKEIAALFQGEAKTLQYLESKGMKGLPHCFYVGYAKEDNACFVQSTKKTQHSKVVHEWSSLHSQYLNELQVKSQQSILFEQSDYYKTVQDLKNHLDWLPSTINQTFVSKVISDIVDNLGGKQVVYSAYHADFTPWNMFVEKGELFVFDWEYAQLTYPPQLDRYHFFTQTAIFEKHWNSDDIISYIESSHSTWIDKKMYVLYLVDIMARFTIREKGNVTGDIAKSFVVWTDLLEYLRK